MLFLRFAAASGCKFAQTPFGLKNLDLHGLLLRQPRGALLPEISIPHSPPAARTNDTVAPVYKIPRSIRSLFCAKAPKPVRYNPMIMLLLNT